MDSSDLCVSVMAPQLSEWQTHLDSRLPEPLLSVVQWITGAETFLEASEDAPTEADEHTAKLLTASLGEHMVWQACLGL